MDDMRKYSDDPTKLRPVGYDGDTVGTSVADDSYGIRGKVSLSSSQYLSEYDEKFWDYLHPKKQKKMHLEEFCYRYVAMILLVLFVGIVFYIIYPVISPSTLSSSLAVPPEPVSSSPSFSPTPLPTYLPTSSPTSFPSSTPTVSPSSIPSESPSPAPSNPPTTPYPTSFPSTAYPTDKPTNYPTKYPLTAEENPCSVVTEEGFKYCASDDTLIDCIQDINGFFVPDNVKPCVEEDRFFCRCPVEEIFDAQYGCVREENIGRECP